MNQKSSTERLLQQKEQEIDLLQQIVQTIGSSSSLQEILNRICEIVVKVTRADAGFIYLSVNEEEQALVLRAKGVLVKEHRIFEPEVFKLIQRQSMNTRKSMREIAEAIILASEINQGRRVL